MALRKKAQDNTNDNKNVNSKSYAILAMALIAMLSVLAIFGATYILLQLKFKEEIVIGLSDWLKMVIPIVGGAMVTIFAFLGVDRLKNFDERQDRLAKELRLDLNAQVDNAVKLVQPRLNEAYLTWEKNLQEKLTEYDKAFSAIADRIDKYEKIIGSVEKLEEVSDAIGNIEEAHRFIAELFSNSSATTTEKAQRTRILVALVERVKSSEIKGDSSDYHNLASELARHSYFDFASDVTRIGMKLFSDDIDLLSDFTYYSQKAGRADDVKEALHKVESIEKNLWNWRMFTFYIDVLNDGEANDENKKRVLQCIDDYKRVLPDDERAYMAEYQTYKKYGELDLAESALLVAEDALAMTAQCSLVLSEIYHMRGEHDKAINSASRAILGQAETQPSSNTGAAFAHRGFSKDAKAHKAILDGHSVETQYELIQSAINDYRMAKRFGYSFMNVQARIEILIAMLPPEMQEKAKSFDLEDRMRKIELTLAMLVKHLSSKDE